MPKSIKERLLLSGVAVSLVASMVSMPAYAQVDDEIVPTPAEEERIEELLDDEVIVTGSRIARTVGDAPIPLISLSQEQLFESGFIDLADFLSDTPALQGSQVPDDTTGATLNAAGLSLLNLRQLGTNRTLTLVDGQRQVASVSGTSAVDISTIPQIAIERTEVATGGASAIYGADAVSGVVNFILVDDFEGVELDGTYQEDRNGFNDSFRLSGMVGGNFDDDRGNAFIAVELRNADELVQSDVDFYKPNAALIRIDSDTDNPEGVSIPDGQPNFGLFTNATLDIINNAGVVNAFGPNGISPTGNFFTFNSSGQAIPFLQGTDPRTGALIGSSATLIGGDGPGVDTGLIASLTPSSEVTNLMSKISYELTPSVELFVDGRYSHTSAQTSFQPSFFSGAPNFIGQPGTADDPRQLGAQRFGVTPFTAIDNAFLDPAAVTAINGNLGVASVQRFQGEFNRSQDATRELFRVVGGLRGEIDSLVDSDDIWQWEVSGNFGRTLATNRQLNVRLNDSFFAGADAIRINQADIDRIAAAGGTSGFSVGDVVCRVQYLQAVGLPASVPGVGNISQQVIDGCVPFSVFGENQINGDALEYVQANLNDRFEQEQVVFNASLNGPLGDFWGAGDMFFVAGAEYREERSETNPDELALERDTFANVIQPTAGKFSVTEVFGELEIPILTETPFAEQLTVAGAARYSDYTTIGETFTWSARGEWEPITDLRFSGGFARSVRAPNIGELFQAPAQTFFQILDPCDSVSSVPNADDPTVRAANCAAAGIAADFIDPNPNISNSGFNGGNPDLIEETSDTYFFGVSWRPSFEPDFVIDLDYFNIDIEDATTTLGAQTVVNNCYDSANGIDNAFCAAFERDPANGNEIANINVAPINAAFFATEGIDFEALYRKDLSDIFGASASDYGSLTLRLQGTHLINFDTQPDPLDDTTFDTDEGEIGFPEWRFNTRLAWDIGRFGLTYRVDWQSSQNVFDEQNPDIRDAAGADIPSEFLKTGSFDQHDLTGTFELGEGVVLRGGVINIFDNDPPLYAVNNIFDIFGRRMFIGFNAKF